MKKVLGILTVLVAITMLFTVAFAEDAKSKVPENLQKAYAKMTDNASYTMTTTTKVQDKEMKSVSKAFFKDAKNYRMDSEAMGMKSRTVVNGETAWTYMEAQNMIMSMPVPPAANTELKKDIEYVEGKDGENVTFTFTDAASKMKVVTTVSPKDQTVVKTAMINEKGEVISTSVYSDWKFDKIDDSMFKKPEGAKEMQMPQAPQT
ncbi:MAG TPA: hypothetical protein PKK26_19730, partial [Candidatus Wallbacteria bacterium]|nr:hypothetical protein [Candidatus Wallbacteria bacterium]